MGSDFKSIPIIDIRPLLEKSDDANMVEDEGVLKVVKQLDEACKEAGFFYVTGHGIPDSLIKEVREMTKKFFDLSYEEKLRIKMTPKTGYRGYQRIGENVTKGTPDIHEAIDCYTEIEPGKYGSLGQALKGSNLWPDNPTNFKSLMEHYINLLKDLSRKIMRGIALALGGAPDAFEGEIAGDPFWVTRIIGYPGLSESKNQENMCNDIGWLGINPVTGYLQCQYLELLFATLVTCSRYSPMEYMIRHYIRVINNSPKYRFSVAFFYETNFKTHAKPLDFCVEKTGGVEKFEGVVFGEYLVSKVTTNFVM